MSWPIVAVAGVCIAAAAAPILGRLIPVPEGQHHAQGPERPPGDYPQQGRFTAVRDVADTTSALARLAAVAANAPRTRRLAGSVAEGHASFVTRTRVVGFPDVSNLWIRDGRLYASGNLVVGRSDMGVNAHRIRAWLRAADLL